MLQETEGNGQREYTYIEPRLFDDCESPLEQEEMNRYYTYSVIRPGENFVVEKEQSRCPSVVEFFTSSWNAFMGLAREVIGPNKEKAPPKNN